MAIDFQHPDYKANIDRWNLCENICAATNVTQYLLKLNPNDESSENRTRNKQYNDRAVFYPVSGHTLAGTTGLIFAKDPTIELPTEMEYLRTNVDGAGVTLEQQMQSTAEEMQKKGGGGLFVSYPKTDGPVSKADMVAGGYMSTIHKIDRTQIINWRTEKRGAEVVLSLVVIEETVTKVKADGYETEDVKQIRELALENNKFIVREWQKNDDTWNTVSEYTPTDSAGNSWSIIPFAFLGAVSNSVTVDDPPMYPMCEINKAHYRNSADYEDSVWYVGQAQPWASGLTQSHVDLMKKNNMYVGSRNLMGVPSKESFGFASAPPNTMVKEAMTDKLEVMIGLGARFIQSNQSAKTATEAAGDNMAQYSGLGMVSKNLSAGYEQAVQWAMRYMGASGDVEIETTTDFVSPVATAQDIQAMVAGFVQGAIPVGDYFRWLKKMDLTDPEKSLDQFSEEVDTSTMPDLDEEEEGETET